jgi:Xaa-Pro dipeptidase
MKDHRAKVLERFEPNQSAVIYISGASVMNRYGTDYEFAFRQESNFLYLTGVDEPDYQAVFDLKSGTYHLFAPERDTMFAVWNGKVETKEEINAKYQPDELHYDTDLEEILKALGPDTVYCLDEDDAELMEDLGFETDDTSLADALVDSRIIKTDWEAEQLRAANNAANKAHRALLSVIRPGLHEYDMKAVYEYELGKMGLFQDPYSGIYAAGTNGAILHYTQNNAELKDGELFLIDAGAEYKGYAADFTRTYPVNGKFSADQKELYNVCLEAHKKTIEGCVAGAKMEDLHILAAKIILEGLKEIGLLNGSVEDMMEKNIFALFFPHGLGHFIGLDTHDVGGYPKGVDRIDRPGIKYLRARRELEPGMVLTIEPGLYMIPALLKPAFEDSEQREYLNTEKLEKLLNFGGIRIEDNIMVTENGYENFTDVPKEVSDLEKIINS